MGQLRYPPNEIPRNVNPPGTRCIQIDIPDDDEWEQLLYSVAYRQLALVWTNWKRTGDRTGADLNIRWRQALRTWRHCDGTPSPIGTPINIEDLMSDLIQVICDDSGKCILQYRCDVCSPWQTVANLTDLQTNPSGANNQPSPGGGTSGDCVTLFCNQTYAIPIPVSSGDKIEITKAEGKWSDQFARWLCIDGNLFFIECTGTGGASGAAGDFLPSANHLSLIVQFSTGYYALYPGATLIVPSGVTNEQPTLLANKPTVNSGEGWIDICWKVTNNKPVTGCSTDNFLLSPGDWTPNQLNSGIDDAIWLPVQGWSTQDVQVPIDWERIVYIHKNFAPGKHVTSVIMTYDLVAGGYDGCGSGGLAIGIAINGTNVTTIDIGHVVSGSGLTLSWTGSTPLTSIDLFVVSCCDTGSLCSSGSALITSVEVCTTT